MYKKNVQSKNVSVQNDTEKKRQHQPHRNGEQQWQTLVCSEQVKCVTITTRHEKWSARTRVSNLQWKEDQRSFANRYHRRCHTIHRNVRCLSPSHRLRARRWGYDLTFLPA